MTQVTDDILPPKNVANIEGKPTFSFKTWYALNKEKLSETRKKKYETDPEYRAKLKVRAEKYRKDRPKKERKKSTRMTVPLLCEAAECSPHTYRKYCLQGWIPVLTNRIVFNATHVALLQALCAAARDSRYLRTDRLEHLQPYITALNNGWK